MAKTNKISILPTKAAHLIINDLLDDRDHAGDIAAITICEHDGIRFHSSVTDPLKLLGMIDLLKRDIEDAIMCGDMPLAEGTGEPNGS